MAETSSWSIGGGEVRGFGRARVRTALWWLSVAIAPLVSACGGGSTPEPATLLSNVEGPVDTGTLPDASYVTFDGDVTGGTCKPRTCADVGANCGPIADGCGGLVASCGTCTAPQICGGAGAPSVCGNSVNDGGGCIPLTCAQAGANCGPIGDGCGGALDCGTCASGQSCGGAGTPSVCGVKFVGADGGTADGAVTCKPRTCADAGADCGPIGDGCGGIVQCGTCSSPLLCGGAGTPSVCGNPFARDGAVCAPRTCADLGANCGPIGDGCGGTVDCGTCSGAYICGGGGTPSVCGNPYVGDGGAACTPRTCADVGANCGPVGDGCGGTVDCGTCSSPYLCGGGGTPNRCGNPYADDAGVVCKPQTCATANANCGLIGDGCGGTLGCGSCIAPDICGGGGTPSRCGGGGSASSASCTTPLCKQQIVCPASGVTTTLSGTVYAPTPSQFGAADPIFDAVVYIPKSGTVAPFASSLTCDRCGTGASTDAIVSAVTGPDGKFVLRNVPVGANIPVVIEVGRWRRFVVVSNVSACVDTPLSAAQTRLPRWQSEGNPLDAIPHMALATGNVDALECVLRKIGIDDREFTDPSGAGRVHLYAQNGAVASKSTPSIDTLMNGLAATSSYDAVLLACQGFEGTARSATQKANLLDYANAGGRVFATHFNYMWLFDNAAFATTANWALTAGNPTGDDTKPLPGLVDTTFAKGAAFSQWLANVGALGPKSPPPEVDIYASRQDVKDDGVTRPSQRWIYSTNPPAATIQHLTFNTPVGSAAASQCGRVIFSDFHVNAATTYGKTFPAECTTTPLSAQEKVLEFMLFDLASCVSADNAPPPPPPTCTPRSCAAAGATCGPIADGCGGILACGTCPTGQTCGGAGVPNQCGGPTCTPLTCTKLGYSCGLAGDGCGKTIDCGTCPAGETCGGGGVAGVCGGPSCKAQTCASVGATCGWIGDGCGSSVQCGPCPAGETCGGGGVANQCGGPKCTPLRCASLGATCGWIGDGCGGSVNCGDCAAPDTCGGAGVPSQCGHNGTASCVPLTCTSAGAGCGPIADGCGALLDCGPCKAGQTCGGGGVPNQCGGPTCTPTTCSALGFECGPAGDGCGGLLDCGTCPTGQTCGGGGIPNHCGGLR
jgi:hypothetical protein